MRSHKVTTSSASYVTISTSFVSYVNLLYTIIPLNRPHESHSKQSQRVGGCRRDGQAQREEYIQNDRRCDLAGYCQSHQKELFVSPLCCCFKYNVHSRCQPLDRSTTSWTSTTTSTTDCYGCRCHSRHGNYR